jgi:hypothetical protein
VPSAKALGRFLPDRISKSPVEHHGHDFARTEFGQTTLFFYKPAVYSFEREFQVLLAPEEHESIRGGEIKRHVSVQVKNMIHRVIIDARAITHLKEKVRALRSKRLKRAQHEREFGIASILSCWCNPRIPADVVNAR